MSVPAQVPKNTNSTKPDRNCVVRVFTKSCWACGFVMAYHIPDMLIKV